MIYTSNYARKGTDPTAISISYSIVPGIREWFMGGHNPDLGPDGSLLGRYKAGKVTDEEYVHEYIAILTKRNLSPERILEELPNDCYLLCYEAPFNFCHRRVLADYVLKSTGVYIPEWFNEKETHRFTKMAEQQNIVDSLLIF